LPELRTMANKVMPARRSDQIDQVIAQLEDPEKVPRLISFLYALSEQVTFRVLNFADERRHCWTVESYIY
jgi:hypothetical protein